MASDRAKMPVAYICAHPHHGTAGAHAYALHPTPVRSWDSPGRQCPPTEHTTGRTSPPSSSRITANRSTRCECLGHLHLCYTCAHAHVHPRPMSIHMHVHMPVPQVLFFYGGANHAPKGLRYPSAARHGSYKAHFATGPGLGGCTRSASAPAGCPSIVYTGGPLLFNIDVPSHPPAPCTLHPALCILHPAKLQTASCLPACLPACLPGFAHLTPSMTSRCSPLGPSALFTPPRCSHLPGPSALFTG